MFWVWFILGLIVLGAIGALCEGQVGCLTVCLVAGLVLIHHFSLWYWAGVVALVAAIVAGLFFATRGLIAWVSARKMRTLKVIGETLKFKRCSVPLTSIRFVGDFRWKCKGKHRDDGVSILLDSGLWISVPGEYIHQSFRKWRKSRGNATSTIEFDSFAEVVAAKDLHKKLSACGEVNCSTPDLAVRATFDYFNKTLRDKGDLDVRAAIEITEFWMAKYMQKDSHGDLMIEAVKTRALLMSRLDQLDPIMAYQTYSYYDKNRGLQNIAERVALLNGVGTLPFASERRVIVCTDHPREQGTLNERVPGVLIATASDIHAYNNQASIPLCEKFEFLPAGHPLSDCTYIQHPTRKNCYIESSVYHLTILERKFVELQSIMRNLGAVLMEVESGTVKESGSSYGHKSSMSNGGKYKGFGGMLKNSSSAEGSSFERLMHRLCMKGKWSPVAYRKLPDNLEFFENEAQWKEIADAALQGQMPEVRVRLEIKKEAESSCKSFSDIMANVSCLIADLDCSNGHELERSGKQLESLYLDYHVVFDKSTQQKIEDMSLANQSADGVQLTETQRAKALILRMARQFLAESGTITEENKKEIGGIAAEFGVQKLQVLELIQSAKEQNSSPVQSIEMK